LSLRSQLTPNAHNNALFPKTGQAEAIPKPRHPLHAQHKQLGAGFKPTPTIVIV